MSAGRPWAAMSARELVEARARLYRAGIERARRLGADGTRRVLERRLSEVCGEGERLGRDGAR